MLLIPEKSKHVGNLNEEISKFHWEATKSTIEIGVVRAACTQKYAVENRKHAKNLSCEILPSEVRQIGAKWHATSERSLLTLASKYFSFELLLIILRVRPSSPNPYLNTFASHPSETS